MRRTLILLPLLLATLAVGFLMVYRSTTYAEGNIGEDLKLTDGARNVYEDVTSDSGTQTSVPRDIFYTRSVESVVFSHKTHAVDLGYKCDNCHTSLFQMKAHSVESRPDFNMAGLAAGKYCGACHSPGGNTAFASDTQCARCHRGVKGLERAEKAEKAQNES